MWYDNHQNVVDLGWHLWSLGELETAEEVLRFFDKPHKWGKEWNELEYLRDKYLERNP